MVSCKSCFFKKFDPRTKQVRFWELKMLQNQSSGAMFRVQKSIRILGWKKEGPKSRKVSPKSKFRSLSRDILDPRVLGNEQFLWLLDTPKPTLIISQRLWAKARRIRVFYCLDIQSCALARVLNLCDGYLYVFSYGGLSWRLPGGGAVTSNPPTPCGS